MCACADAKTRRHTIKAGRLDDAELASVRDDHHLARGRFAQRQDQAADAPPREQALALEQTLREIEDDPLSYERLARAWADSDLAALQFDRSGTTHIGKYVINHSFILPGLIGVSTSCLIGFLLADVNGLI